MSGERVALRPDRSGDLDDVVVRGVSMFRAERMDNRNLWLCCYIDGTGEEHDRIVFNVRATRGGLEFGVGEWPAGTVTYENGSIRP